MRDLHDLGIIHQDIKPENILLGSSDFNNVESSIIYLIDFGISKFYRVDGVHIKRKKGQYFSGNVLFSSKNAFRNLELSR